MTDKKNHQPVLTATKDDKAALGLPECGKPLCAPGEHHPLCRHGWAQEKAASAPVAGEAMQLLRSIREQDYLSDTMRNRIDRLLTNSAPQASEAQKPEGWTEAYAAFVGAFDTPQMRRKLNDDYANDARVRLRELNERYSSSPAPKASEAVRDAGMPASVAQLVAAAKGMTKLYPHVWDRPDGGLVVFPENVARFDAAFDALRIAVGEAVEDDDGADGDAQDERKGFGAVRDRDHPVFAFLLGEGLLHGVEFGKRAPGAVGKWWWRKDLRAALSAQPTSKDDNLEEVAPEVAADIAAIRAEDRNAALEEAAAHLESKKPATPTGLVIQAFADEVRTLKSRTALDHLVDGRQAWAADMVAAGARHLGGECWEWDVDDFEYSLWRRAVARGRALAAQSAAKNKEKNDA